MRPTSGLAFAQTVRTASKQFVRVQLNTAVERLGAAGEVVLVRPGRMRNHLLPTKQAVYLPLDTTATRAKQRIAATRIVAQQEVAQKIIEEQVNREILTREIGAVQLLSLRRKLEQIPPIGLTRLTTTKYNGKAEELPQPPLTIQGSISRQDLVDFLRQADVFTLETDFSVDEDQVIPLNRLTDAQIFTACEFTLTPAEGITGGSLDKLDRIKTTGRYELTILLISSNIRVRVPITVKPQLGSSASTSSSESASLTSKATPSPVQTRGYATQARNSPRMESSMRQKLQAEFEPAEVNIRNDSSKHAHHAAMAAQGGGNGETHFFVEIISDKFTGMTQIKRHRVVNALLQQEFELGLHALSLRTKTFAEVEKVAPPTTSTQMDGTECPNTPKGALPKKKRTGASPEEIDERGGSLWTAPQSLMYPTAPIGSPSPSQQLEWEQEQKREQIQRDKDILEAFYTRPPAPVPTMQTARTAAADAVAAPITLRERQKFFRRVTKNENVPPSVRQNLFNILGGVLAAGSAIYMVLFVEFDQHSISNPDAGGRKENCFTPIRQLVFGPEAVSTPDQRIV